jgi:predicted amidophosphoribosyltransferase
MARSKLIKDKNVLLIDDVFTSGATMESASSELIQAGANKVWCLTLAKVNYD